MPEEDWQKYNWGVVHVAHDEGTAMKYLRNYSYDAIILTTGISYPEVQEYLINEYAYDSVIVLYGVSPADDLTPDMIQVGQAGYIVLPVDDLSLLLCYADKLIWETHGNTAHHK